MGTVLYDLEAPRPKPLLNRQLSQIDGSRAMVQSGAIDPPGGDSPRMQRLGTLYRGREGMWTWVLHRVSGVAILFYLFAHVADTALVNVSPEAYNRVIGTYRTPFVGVLEIGLAVLVIFHALNGVRVILFDFWSRGVARQRQMLYVQAVLFVALAVPPVIAIGAKVLRGE